MPRFPSARALIALFIAIVCLSWRTTALAQDAGAPTNRVAAPFAADGGAPRAATKPQNIAQGDAGATGRPGHATAAAPSGTASGDAGTAKNADGGAPRSADGGPAGSDDLGEPGDGLRTPAGEEVTPRPIALPTS